MLRLKPQVWYAVIELVNLSLNAVYGVCIICENVNYLLPMVWMSGRGGGIGAEGDTDPPVDGPANLHVH